MKKRNTRRGPRQNPKPRAWSTKGPSRAYECKSPLVGRTVRLGRSEHVVESCATPSRRRPNQGQFRVRSKATGQSRAVPRRRVSSALYRAKHPRKMPPGLKTYWARTREPRRSTASPAVPQAPQVPQYGPRESLGVGGFEDPRPIAYGPRESLGVGGFEEGRPRGLSLASPAAVTSAPPSARRSSRRRSRDLGPELPMQLGLIPGGFEDSRPIAYGPRESLGVGGFEDPRPIAYGPRESLGVGGFEDPRPQGQATVSREHGIKVGGGTRWVVFVVFKMTWRRKPLPKSEPRWFADLNGKTRETRFEREVKTAQVPLEAVAGYAAAPSTLVEDMAKWTSEWAEEIRGGDPTKAVHVVDMSVAFSSPVREGQSMPLPERRQMYDGPSRVVAFYLPAYRSEPTINNDMLRAVGAEVQQAQERSRPKPVARVSDEAREAMRDNPMRWRANHHGGWHAPGDPLGYGPRANRTRKARKARRRSR